MKVRVSGDSLPRAVLPFSTTNANIKVIFIYFLICVAVAGVIAEYGRNRHPCMHAATDPAAKQPATPAFTPGDIRR
jgi:amino acid transporter